MLGAQIEQRRFGTSPGGNPARANGPPWFDEGDVVDVAAHLGEAGWGPEAIRKPKARSQRRAPHDSRVPFIDFADLRLWTPGSWNWSRTGSVAGRRWRPTIRGTRRRSDRRSRRAVSKRLLVVSRVPFMNVPLVPARSSTVAWPPLMTMWAWTLRRCWRRARRRFPGGGRRCSPPPRTAVRTMSRQAQPPAARSCARRAADFQHLLDRPQNR